MKEIKVETFKVSSITVSYTDKFIEDFDEFAEHFSKYFRDIETIEQFTHYVANQVIHDSYIEKPYMVEGVGSPWLLSYYDSSAKFKPVDCKWERAEDDEEPECGIYITRTESATNSLLEGMHDSEIDDLNYLLDAEVEIN